jgi:hypothetical protein
LGEEEGVLEKLTPIEKCNAIVGHIDNISAGVGLHDSSAALIPYLTSLMTRLYYYRQVHGV